MRQSKVPYAPNCTKQTCNSCAALQLRALPSENLRVVDLMQPPPSSWFHGAADAQKVGPTASTIDFNLFIGILRDVGSFPLDVSGLDGHTTRLIVATSCNHLDSCSSVLADQTCYRPVR